MPRGSNFQKPYPPVKPRTIRDWYRDVPGFREASARAVASEDDIAAVTPRSVLEHLLLDPRPEIRLRSAAELSKLTAPGAAAADQVLQVFLGPRPGGGCACDTCEEHRQSPLVPYTVVDDDTPDDPTIPPYFGRAAYVHSESSRRSYRPNCRVSAREQPARGRQSPSRRRAHRDPIAPCHLRVQLIGRRPLAVGSAVAAVAWIESLGAPMRVTENPENPDDQCRWTIYKSPEFVPDWAYERVGKQPPARA